MKILASLLISVLTLSTSTGFAAEWFISPTGSDLNPGNITKPWKTIQKAAGLAKAGDTVYIRGGTYPELVNILGQGTASARLTFQNYAGERVILTGAGKTIAKNASSAVVNLANRNYVTIRGLEVANLVTSTLGSMPLGIFVSATGSTGSTGVEILDCAVYNIRHDNPTLYSFDANAHGIAVYGYSTAGVTNIRVSGNIVHDLRLGASEAMVFNGNVSGASVLANTVYNCNNIGIDFIGYEGTCKTRSLDRARNSVCCGNVVYNIDSQFNPAYGGNFSGKFSNANARNDTRAAPAIYVDGGDSILIERNVMSGSNFGLSLSSEHFGANTTNCIVRNNLIRHNHVGGIVLGGADTSNGGTVNCRIINNTLAYNDTTGYGGGSVMIQHYTTGSTIKNNLMVSVAASAAYTPQFVLKSSTTGSFSANAIDYNIYAGAPVNDVEFLWNGLSKSAFAAWQAVGQDKNSLFVPGAAGFLNVNAGDYRILATSIAKDRGDPAMRPASGEMDNGGGVRLFGARVDVGMDEVSQ